jgi:hypothetical protein
MREDWYQWEGEVGKELQMLNMVQILCTYVCKWKMISIETIPGKGGRRVQRRMVEGVN